MAIEWISTFPFDEYGLIIPLDRKFFENPSKIARRTDLIWNSNVYWCSHGIFLNLDIAGYNTNPCYRPTKADVHKYQTICKGLLRKGSLRDLCNSILKRETRLMDEQETYKHQFYASTLHTAESTCPSPRTITAQPSLASVSSPKMPPPPPPPPLSQTQPQQQRRSPSPNHPPPPPPPPNFPVDASKLYAIPSSLLTDTKTVQTLKHGDVFNGLRVWRNDDTRVANVFVCLEGPPMDSDPTTETELFDTMCNAIPAHYNSTMVLSIQWAATSKPWMQNIA